MGSKVHVPEHQWRREQRKKKFKNKKRNKKNQHKHRRGDRRRDIFDDDDFDLREWQEKWRD